MAADLPDGRRAEFLALADEQQAVGTVDPGGQDHAGLQLVEHDFAHLAGQAGQLVAAWQPQVTRLGNLSRKWNKPILFTEIGYRSIDGANTAPWDYQVSAKIDLQEQADSLGIVRLAGTGEDRIEGGLLGEAGFDKIDRDGQAAGGPGDLLARDAVGIAAAVETLVVGANRFAQGRAAVDEGAEGAEELARDADQAEVAEEGAERSTWRSCSLKCSVSAMREQTSTSVLAWPPSTGSKVVRMRRQSSSECS